MEDATRRRAKSARARRISKALREAGHTHESLAKQLGKARSTVSEVVRGRMKNAAVAAAIAAALGRQPHEIWPRLYAAPEQPSAPTTEPTDEPAPAPTALAS